MIVFIQIILTIITGKQGKMVAKDINAAAANFVHHTT
jgi:hypothetical protein